MFLCECAILLYKWMLEWQRKSEKEYTIDEENVPGEDLLSVWELFYTQVILQYIITFFMPTTWLQFYRNK